jgi:hypothetical protein
LFEQYALPVFIIDSHGKIEMITETGLLISFGCGLPTIPLYMVKSFVASPYQ